MTVSSTRILSRSVITRWFKHKFFFKKLKKSRRYHKGGPSRILQIVLISFFFCFLIFFRKKKNVWPCSKFLSKKKLNPSRKWNVSLILKKEPKNAPHFPYSKKVHEFEVCFVLQPPFKVKSCFTKPFKSVSTLRMYVSSGSVTRNQFF